MNFENIPYDSHVCMYNLGLYSQSTKEVILRWGTAQRALDGWEKAGTAVWKTTGLVQQNIVYTYNVGSGTTNFSHTTAYLSISRKELEYVESYIILSIAFVLMYASSISVWHDFLGRATSTFVCPGLT